LALGDVIGGYRLCPPRSEFWPDAIGLTTVSSPL